MDAMTISNGEASSRRGCEDPMKCVQMKVRKDPPVRDYQDSINQVKMEEEEPDARNPELSEDWLKVEVGEEFSDKDAPDFSNPAKTEEAAIESARHCGDSANQVQAEGWKEVSDGKPGNVRKWVKVNHGEPGVRDHQTSGSGGRIIQSTAAGSELYIEKQLPKSMSIQDSTSVTTGLQQRLLQCGLGVLATPCLGGQQKEKGKKQPKFSERELEVLVDAVLPVEPWLLGAEYHTTTNVVRDAMWEAIADKVNAVGPYNRERFFVRKRWNNLRLRVKNLYEAAVIRERQTGIDGPDTVNWEPWERKMLDTVGTATVAGLEYGTDTDKTTTNRSTRRRSTTTSRISNVRGHLVTTEKTASRGNMSTVRASAVPESMRTIQPTPSQQPMATISSESLPMDTISSGTVSAPQIHDDAIIHATEPSSPVVFKVCSNPISGIYEDYVDEDKDSGPVCAINNLYSPSHSQSAFSSSPSLTPPLSPTHSSRQTPAPDDSFRTLTVGQSSEWEACAQESIQVSLRRQRGLLARMMRQEKEQHDKQMFALGAIQKSLHGLGMHMQKLTVAVRQLAKVSGGSPRHVLPVLHFAGNTTASGASSAPRDRTPSRGPQVRRRQRTSVRGSVGSIPAKRRKL